MTNPNLSKDDQLPFLIQDSREQKGIFKKENVIIQKLDVGDYTTVDLLGVFHIERKSPTDLYSSITWGHERFRREIMRAKENNIKLVIFVECPERTFLFKEWNFFARSLRMPTSKMSKILDTIQNKYELEMVWCFDRDDLKERMLEVFKSETDKINK